MTMNRWTKHRAILQVFLLAAALALTSCGADKGAATAAIKAADDAFAPVKASAAQVLPEEAQAIEDSLASAKASLDSGNAKAALATAQPLAGQISALTTAVEAKKAELSTTWQGLSAGLPGVVEAIQSRMDMLSKSKGLPAGIDQAAMDGAKSTFETAKQMWTEAQAAQASGDWATAVTQAQGVKSALVQVLTALKMPVPPALAS